MRKHWQKFLEAWSKRHSNQPNDAAYTSLEREFLPALLEIQASPPAPLGRIIVWLIIAFFILAVFWAVIGRVNIVASAQGEIVPEGRIKVVQPKEGGVVRKIHVGDGGFVRQGEMLVELDLDVNQADIQAVQERISKLNAALEIARERASALEALYEQDFVSLSEFREAESEVFQIQHEIGALEQEHTKAKTRFEWQLIRAPISGYIHDIEIFTEGGVVSPAQSLMKIVPSDSKLIALGYLPNKDIGFIEAGQQAIVKLETFQFTKYGYIEGEVLHVSSDAIEIENIGKVYLVKVGLTKEYLTVKGKQSRLSPGMTATVEIKTGSRRIIEYFLSPLLKSGSESIRER